MLLWPPLTGTKLSPVAPRSWAIPSVHTPGNRYDQRAKPNEGLRCCVFLHTRTDINTADAQALPTCPRCQRIFRALIGLVGHPRFQCDGNPTTSTSATPASNPTTTTTTPTTDNHFINDPPPTITDTVLPPLPHAPIPTTNTTCPTPTTSVATSDYLLPPTSPPPPVPAMGTRY
ncbi:unnamed protein product [Schistocephalus solidus]|uniref:C2H2-type domain-containing protein n=1 Tax=Schistocephalus solidus TaxID=70667 RepID=A0A183SUT0_SCHSO|nr:unnamed protein product [Schistocephalus solidus]